MAGIDDAMVDPPHLAELTILLSAPAFATAVYPAQPSVGAELVCVSDSGLTCFDRRQASRPARRAGTAG